MSDGERTPGPDRRDERDPWDPFRPASDALEAESARPGEMAAPVGHGQPTPDEDDAEPADIETYGLSHPPARAVETEPAAFDVRPGVTPAGVDARGAETRPSRRRRRKRARSRESLAPRPVPDAPLRSAIGYPFQGAGVPVLAMYAALLGMSRLVPVVGPLLGVVVMMYMSLLFLETASHTLDDIPGGPRFPSLDLADVQAGLYGMTVMLIGMTPYVFLRVLIARLGGESPVWDLVLWPLPMYYLPMAYLVLADMENERGLDPRWVVRAIGQVGGAYFVAVTLAAAVFLVAAVTLTLLELPPPILEPINAFLMMSAMVALLRAVGLLYLRKGVVVRFEDEAADRREPRGEQS